MGQTLGRLWRGCLRHERTVNSWLVAQGLPAGVAKIVSLLIKLVAFGVILYIASWLVLLLVFAVAAAYMSRDSDHDESEEWAVGDQAEHKSNPGYHLVLYNDAPDSRYADPRYDDD